MMFVTGKVTAIRWTVRSTYWQVYDEVTSRLTI